MFPNHLEYRDTRLLEKVGYLIRRRDTPRAHWCQQSPESLDKSRFYLSPDPPKSPLRRGTKEKTLVPPFLRGARGDLDLIVKQQSVIGFDVKLTPMGIAVSKAALLQSSPEIFVFFQ
jgi:hypothetical protein